MPGNPVERRAYLLGRYFLVTYLVLLINVAAFPARIRYDGMLTFLFVAATYLTYSLIYLLPAIGLTFAAHGLAAFWGRRTGRALDRPVYAIALILACATQSFIYADGQLFGLFRCHLNGFVWNLVWTRGGLASMGAGAGATGTGAIILAGIFAFQSLLLFIVLRAQTAHRMLDRFLTRRAKLVAASVALALTVGGEVAYGVCVLCDYAPVPVAADAFPLYLSPNVRKLATSLGVESADKATPIWKRKPMQLHYPLAPIRRDREAPRYNIVWLMAESWRADMLHPEISPETWKFAQSAVRFDNHYSGGNGTRMGLFSLFYGLHGNYWFAFRDDRRGPVLMDTMKSAGYQFRFFSSARFTYPELDKTVLAAMDAADMREADPGPGWKRDQANVTEMLDFISRRKQGRPFMTAAFFESTHSDYHFPPEMAIRKPYAENLNYATMDPARDVTLIKNRYINACHSLDMQMGRVFDYLQKNDLLDSTIVIISGDHGEQFMEKGGWGHNAPTFVEEETRVPLIIRAPGKAPATVSRVTSHVDVPPTIMNLLGVQNPPEDYCVGLDLFGDREHPFLVFAGWNAMGLRTAGGKAVIPSKPYGFAYEEWVTDTLDQPLPDPDAFFRNHQAEVAAMMTDMMRFGR